MPLCRENEVVGSHAVVIPFDHDNMKDVIVNPLAFSEDEICGQCKPCRLGCEKAVKPIPAGPWDGPLLLERLQDMNGASTWGPDGAVPNPIRSALPHFREDMLS